MSIDFEETIIARATAAGSAVRGILRLSGFNSLRAVSPLFQAEVLSGDLPSLLEEKQNNSALSFIQTGSLFPWNNSIPVPAKIFYWQEGKSYTGQESVEIHTVSSPPVLDAITAAVCRSGLVRPAGHGEFTLRAFLSGRIDLTQAEGVLGVIEAENSETLEKALQQLAGGIAAPLKHIRSELFDALSRFEAGLDFVDEDIDFISKEELSGILETALRETLSLQEKMNLRNCGSGKPAVVLTGLPNAGKSTLFNALLGRQAAITSPVAGTTRDYLEGEISFGGIDCILADTAGITSAFDSGQQSAGKIEQTSQVFAKERSLQADIILECLDSSTGLPFPQTKSKEGVITVWTKSDLNTEISPISTSIGTVCVSADTGAGIEDLKREIERSLRVLKDRNQSVLPSTALRCREALLQAVSSLRYAADNITQDCGSLFDETVLAAEIRSAVNSLGLIDGTVHTEDLLDNIFSKFCIGK